MTENINKEDSLEQSNQSSEASDAPHAETTTVEGKLAKAGKRSTKGLREAEEKQAKEERKQHANEASEESSKPKVVIKARPKIERQGKKLREASKKIEKDKEYSLAESMDLAIQTSTTKFDASVELHVRLNVDPRQADQNIRGNLVLPNGTGKSVRVAVFADGDELVAAKKAGADIAGSEEFLQALDKGELNFDILIATPTMMPKLGKYARLLGPKGLMPNPKSGTVTKDVTKVIAESKAGRLEYRVDSSGIIHGAIGKCSFGKEKLSENAKALLTAIRTAKPASVKGNYITSIYTTTSMGPSIKVSPSDQ